MPATALHAPGEDLLEALAEALAGPGWALLEGMLPPSLAEALADEARALAAAGRLAPAGVGRAGGHAGRPDIRGDATCWLDDPACGQAAAGFIAVADGLRQALNRRLMLGMETLEAHYAHYPPGTGYARHRDRFRDDDARVLSMVTYLNPDWQPAHGGSLRLHLPSGARDVEPRFGRTVLFLSAEVEHEVLPTTVDRFSIAGWFRRRSRALV